jgi:hypothetical protein
MSDSNRVAVRIVEESTLGTTPASPAFFDLRYTGAPSLAFAPETVTSEEIRSDAQVTDLILVGGSTEGELNFEKSYGAKDRLYESIFWSAFQARYSRLNGEGATQITAVDADSYTVTSSSVLVLNDIIRAEGFTNAANNGFKFINTGTTATDLLIQGAGLTVETSPPVTARIHLVGRRAATGDLVAATGPNRVTSTVLDFTTLGLAVGDWVKFAAFAITPADNDYVRISAITATALTLDVVPSGWAADAGTGVQVQLYFGERLVNGTTRKSFTVEEEFSDHSPVTYQYLRGMVPDTYSLNAASQEVVTETIGFLGLNAVFQDSSRLASATTLASRTNSVVNASSNVGRIALGGAAVVGSNFVTELVLEVANGLREKRAIGTLSSVDLGRGRFEVTGSLNTYFDNKTTAQAVVNNTKTSIDFRFADDASHVYLWDLPRVKFSEGAPEVAGINTDVVLNPGFQAFMHETLGYTAKLTRFHGVQ